MLNLHYIFQYEFKLRFDPYNDYLKQAVRTALACILAIIVYRSLPQFHEGYWAVLTSAFIIQTRVGNTFKQQLLSVSICGLLASFFSWLAILISPSTISLAIYLAILGAAMIYFSRTGHIMLVRSFFITLFAFFVSSKPACVSFLCEAGKINKLQNTAINAPMVVSVQRAIISVCASTGAIAVINMTTMAVMGMTKIP